MRKLRAQIPNLFDQYAQPENRLTNALLQTLASSRRLAAAFLKDFIGIRCSPHESIEITSQKRPGGVRDNGQSAKRGSDPETIPDGWIVSEKSGWAVVMESKIVEGAVRFDQLRVQRDAVSDVDLLTSPSRATRRGSAVLTSGGCWRGRLRGLT
jgi:hypothetical protein